MSDKVPDQARPERGPNGRFLPGNSGNPKGRPHGGANASALSRQLRRRVSAEVDGRTRRMNIVDALVRQLGDRALEGDLAAAREVIRLAREEAAAEAKAAASVPPEPEPEIRYEIVDTPEWKTALWRLDGLITGEDEQKWRLKRWVVEAAFARRPELRHQAQIYLDAIAEGSEPEPAPR